MKTGRQQGSCPEWSRVHPPRKRAHSGVLTQENRQVPSHQCNHWGAVRAPPPALPPRLAHNLEADAAPAVCGPEVPTQEALTCKRGNKALTGC